MSGSVVLTALQAREKSIDEIGKLTQERRLKAFKEGKNSSEEELLEELATVIYSQCGVSIRNDESYQIAKKLVELGYRKAEE